MRVPMTCADRPLRDQVSGRLAEGIDLGVEVDRQPDAVGARRRDHRLAIGQGGGDRFLDQDVLAGFGRLDRQWRVEVMRHGDVDGIHRGVGQEIVDAVGPGNAVPSRRDPGPVPPSCP